MVNRQKGCPEVKGLCLLCGLLQVRSDRCYGNTCPEETLGVSNFLKRDSECCLLGQAVRRKAGELLLAELSCIILS